MSEQDYVLGTHDEEIARLGLQHRVWRTRALEAWQRAGITVGSRVLDIGAGPGFATLDLGEIVGPTGEVVAFERSERFVASGKARTASLAQTRYVQADLVEDELVVEGFDAAWCRWVMSFVSDPANVVRKVAKSLRPGGIFAMHEYLDYGCWTLIPARPLLTSFVAETMERWREMGGEPDIAMSLLPVLREAGFEVIRAEPLVFTMTPQDYGWQWPRAFVHGQSRLWEEQGIYTLAQAEALRAEFDEAEAQPGALMISPIVLEIVGKRY